MVAECAVAKITELTHDLIITWCAVSYAFDQVQNVWRMHTRTQSDCIYKMAAVGKMLMTSVEEVTSQHICQAHSQDWFGRLWDPQNSPP